MLKKAKNECKQYEWCNCDSIVPQEHLLRQIEEAIDFNEIYAILEPYYCKDNGRASVDPVIVVKMVLLQHIYDMTSLRRTVEEVQMNIAAGSWDFR